MITFAPQNKAVGKYKGLFNNYKATMVVSEKITKDFLHFCFSISNLFKSGLKAQSILVYPEYPSRNSTIYKIGYALGYNVTNKISKRNKVTVYWENKTLRTEQNSLQQLDNQCIINNKSIDISKKYVDQVHQSVFGYSTIVNPKEHKGKMVQKSDVNAKHDGELINGPISNLKKDAIYQILVDNAVADDMIMDIRVPYIGEVTPFVYLKYRPIDERFKNTTVKTERRKTKDVLSSEEIDLIASFCKESDLDFGELDVLRDKISGKIYIVDVNNTPFGPPANISKEEAKAAIKELANTFKKNFL